MAYPNDMIIVYYSTPGASNSLKLKGRIPAHHLLANVGNILKTLLSELYMSGLNVSSAVALELKFNYDYSKLVQAS